MQVGNGFLDDIIIYLLSQDEVRLRLFLDSIGFSDLSAKKIKKWMPEDRRQFEIIQERYRASVSCLGSFTEYVNVWLLECVFVNAFLH